MRLVAAVTGVPGAVLLTAVQTFVQRGTPDRLLGRVGAACQAGDAAAAVLGALLGPAVVAAIGLAAALVVISLAALAAAAVNLALLAPGRDRRPVRR